MHFELPLGPYRVEATLQGVRTFTQTGVVLQVNSSPVIDPELVLGEVAEEVTVVGNTPLVDTRSAGVSTRRRERTHRRTAAQRATGHATDHVVRRRGANSDVARLHHEHRRPHLGRGGGNDFGVSYSLDGAPHLNNFDGTGMHLPFPDALQEFRLVTVIEAGGTIPRRRLRERRDDRHQRGARQLVRVRARQPFQRSGLLVR